MKTLKFAFEINWPLELAGFWQTAKDQKCCEPVVPAIKGDWTTTALFAIGERRISKNMAGAVEFYQIQT